MISMLLIAVPIALYLSGEAGAAFITLFVLIPGMVLFGGFVGLLFENPFDEDFSIFNKIVPLALLFPIGFFAVHRSL